MIATYLRSNGGRLLFMLLLVFILGVSFHGAAQAQSGCPDTITSYWMLDEVSGATYVDSVGGKNASCFGSACPVSVPGLSNNGLAFDGIEDGVSVPLIHHLTGIRMQVFLSNSG